MEFLHQLIFASDADLAVLAGVVLVLLSFLALVAERQHIRRKQIDRVGWMPWTGLFMLAFVSGMGLIAMALPNALSG